MNEEEKEETTSESETGTEAGNTETINETTETTETETVKPTEAAKSGAKSKPKPKPTKPKPKSKPEPKSKPKPKTAKPKSASSSKRKWKKKKKRGGGSPVIIVIVILLIIAIIVAGIFAWRHLSSKSPKASDNADNTQMSETEEITQTASEENTEKQMPEIDIDADVDELFADVDAAVEEAKGKMDEDAEIVNVMNSLSSAVNDYMEKAEDAGDIRAAEERASDTYQLYVEMVEKHKEMMDASTLSGAIYAQVISEIDDALELGNRLEDNGYAIDLSGLKESREAFDSSYRQRIIDTFDEFTTRDAWSRTESWNLMKDTDSMFDASDLDDPIRLRYAYALAWWTQKQIETELASGTITEKGAAIKIAGLLEAMDYNPMMISYYIQYMKSAGESCSSVESAYDEMIEHIRSTQGITLGSDIDLAHFWYFNDISNPSEGVKDGSVNGTTQENREWIRSRMEYAGFAS